MRWILLFIPFLLIGCGEDEDPYVAGLGFDEYVPVYNDYIKRWAAGKIDEANDELAKAEPGSVEAKDAEEAIARYERRLALGDYFNFSTIEKLPGSLPWKDGLNEPEDSDSAAKKGGVFRYYTASPPPTLRPFGPNANSGLRSELYDDVQLGIVRLNRLNGSVVPAMAREWAHSEDKRTWFFKLHEDATYSDGVAVKAKDYAVNLYLRASDYAKAPYYKQYFREEISQITIYNDHTFAISFPNPKSELGMYNTIGDLPPAPPHFYEEFGPDYEDRYNWRHQPITGPYYVADGDVDKGVSLTLTRKKDWWGNDKKFYRYRYNPDKIVWRIVRDPNKAFELFRAGILDMALVSGPKSWYEKSEIQKVYDGYIERHWWYNDFPRAQFGIEMNLSREKLKDINVRLGLAHALNYDKVIQVQFWGDYGRLPGFVDGYGDFVNPNVKPWPFDPAKAREYFAKAGFTEEGNDGVLRKVDGTRLEFTLSHYAIKTYTDIMGILKNEAKKAGIDLILDGKDPSLVFTDAMDKKFELTAVAWAVQPPYFSFYEYFHSRNAYDEQGNIKPKTNNVFAYTDPQMDKWVEAYRRATEDEGKRDLAHKIQQQVYENCVFVPGWKRDYERVACWRWMRWPNSKTVKFCPPINAYPWDHYSFWIDEEMQEETWAAMRSGETFPEVQNVVEMYRKK
ncbi:ABC transporter substrate-binding protein [Akkermansiaceae bacterium]|nr:ABC transporter substrate-binding protein [Akkermansiaceae bacterium]